MNLVNLHNHLIIRHHDQHKLWHIAVILRHATIHPIWYQMYQITRIWIQVHQIILRRTRLIYQTTGILNEDNLQEIIKRKVWVKIVSMTLPRSVKILQPRYLNLRTIRKSQVSNWMRIDYSAGFIFYFLLIPLKLLYQFLRRLKYCLLIIHP